ATPPPHTATHFPYTTLFRSITTTADVNKGNNVEKISDGKLDTIFKPANNDAGEILFHVGEAKKDIDGITLLEDPLNVSHSKLSRSEEHTSELQSRFDLVCRL